MSRPKLVDHWTAARINHLSAELTRLGGGSIAHRFIKKATCCYSQYQSCRRPRLRYRCWAYLDIVADQLFGRGACSSRQLPSQEEAQ
jgi:hypothetical protein